MKDESKKTKNKEYIVSLDVSFTTPLDVIANSENTAGQKAISEFKKTFSEFKKKLNDISDLDIDIGYVEDQDCGYDD